MGKSPSFTPIIDALPASIPFVGPETLERQAGRPLKVRVGANESAFGLSPQARQAMAAALDRISWYNDPEGYDLRTVLANHHSVKLEEVCLGAGIDDLLGLAVRLMVEPGTPVVTSLGSYPTFSYHVKGFGGCLCMVPYKDDHADLQGLVAEVQRVNAKLVYLANPDNPMGTYHTAAALRDFLTALPEDCLVILDEAYSDFAPAGVTLPFTPDDPRLMQMRTFSKAHGMAGARIGYTVVAAPLNQALDKIRHHFGVNRIAQIGALASLGDEAFIQNVVDQVSAGRHDYANLAADLGLGHLPSATNFVAIDLGNGTKARRVLSKLLDHDVFVRMPAVWPLDRCIRVSVGTPAERTLFGTALRRVLESEKEGT
jgi:histidinol-phosphate aminotransferase